MDSVMSSGITVFQQFQELQPLQPLYQNNYLLFVLSDLNTLFGHATKIQKGTSVFQCYEKFGITSQHLLHSVGRRVEPAGVGEERLQSMSQGWDSHSEDDLMQEELGKAEE